MELSADIHKLYVCNIHVTYSPIYPSVEMMICIILTMAVTILLGEVVTLLIKPYVDLCNTTSIWSVPFTCQTRAGVSGDINKSFECVTKTDSKFFNRVWI